MINVTNKDQDKGIEKNRKVSKGFVCVCTGMYVWGVCKGVYVCEEYLTVEVWGM